MSLPLTLQTTSLRRATLEALAYSDLFDQPLRLEELHRYLPVRAPLEELEAALASLNGWVGSYDGLYFLAGREAILEVRWEREARSRKLLPHAVRYGRILGRLPFVRMTALTGSLAVLNVSKNADFDYMLVTAPGRLWTARAFALAVNRITQTLGHTLCPNLIVAETALEWRQYDLYSARELHQMIVITGVDMYRKLMQANEWTRNFLPNATLSLRATAGRVRRYRDRGSEAISSSRAEIASSGFALLAMTERVLRSIPGDRFESWEMNRKIARFSKQAGFGEETVFTAEVCQGNFHHHRKRTHELFTQRLDNLPDDSLLPAGRVPDQVEALGVRAS